mmetsp:Transcript_955/g.1168  ORF Transcript_955/g.1168 Transcript_955/m.1168 type:complete len:112 (-) Transcript_955:1180-1515(-)
MTEIDQKFKRILSQKGVKSVSVFNADGKVIRSSLTDPNKDRQQASLLSALAKNARETIKEMDPNNTLTFLRLRTLTEEILIAPEKKEGKYSLVVVQDPKDDGTPENPAMMF